MVEGEVWTFFYGSYMNLDVLRQVDYVPRDFEVARLPGFDLTMAPIANLVRSEEHSVYGIVATGTHSELERLYQHAASVLGGSYLPEAVLVHTRSERWIPALCYVAPQLSGEAASEEYVQKILSSAREYGFPAGYISKLESFLP